jgi:hypothetical protein
MLQEGVGMDKEGVVLFIGTGKRQIGQGIAGISRRWNLLRRRSRAWFFYGEEEDADSTGPLSARGEREKGTGSGFG